MTSSTEMVDKVLNNIKTEYNLKIKFYKTLRKGKNINTIIFIQSGRNSFIAKIHKDEFTNRQGLVTQGEITQSFIFAGLPFSKRYQTLQGAYYISIKIDGFIHFVTLEDYMDGEEIKVLNTQLVTQIGRMLGRMHRTTRSGISFGYGTTWSLFGGNRTDKLGDYDENELCFRELYEALVLHQYNKKDVQQMKYLYDAKRKQAEELWSTLPSGAIQGDFCPYNMVADASGNVSGIFDFNIAGDEVFINELIALAIYFAYHFKHHAASPKVICDAFIRGYVSERSLESNEIHIANTLFNIIRPFRHDRVDCIMKLMEAGKRDKVESIIRETIKLLDWDYQLDDIVRGRGK